MLKNGLTCRIHNAMKLSQPNGTSAFTLVELCGVLATTLLLVAVVLPARSQVRNKTATMQCADNQRQLALAMVIWQKDANSLHFPWRTPSVQTNPAFQNPWFLWYQFSNQIASPAILADPADHRSSMRIASNWSLSPQGGFLGQNYRGNAVSYVLSIDAGAASGGSPMPMEQVQNQILTMCRHVRADTRGACSAGFTSAAVFQKFGASLSSSVAWTNDVHGPSVGNVALVDGSVQGVTAEGLRKALVQTDDAPQSSGVIHMYFPF